MRKKTIFIFLLVLFIAFLFGSSVYLWGALYALTIDCYGYIITRKVDVLNLDKIQATKI